MSSFLPSFFGKDWSLPGNLVGFGWRVEHLNFVYQSETHSCAYISLAGEYTGLIKLCYSALVMLINLVNIDKARF